MFRQDKLIYIADFIRKLIQSALQKMIDKGKIQLDFHLIIVFVNYKYNVLYYII